LGDSRIVIITPTADTANKSFGVSPGSLTSNYSAIDETVVDFNDFVYSNVQGALDLYTTTGLSFNPAKVHGIQPVFYGRKDILSARNARIDIVTGATTINGPSHSMTESTTTFFRYSDPIISTNPATGQPWSANELSNIKFGPEIL
jgi:hypothetical protein